MKEILLTQGKTVLVDDNVFEGLNQFNWYYCKGYAVKKVSGKTIFMHRFLTDAPANMDVDHKDGNTLNNQSTNLRICTRAENQRNKIKRRVSSSQFKGVGYTNVHGTEYWLAFIQVEGKSKRKYFTYTSEGEIEAAKWYNELAVKHFGEFARLNEIPQGAY